MSAPTVEISLAPMLTTPAISASPLEVIDVNVPTDVMFGWAAVYTVPATNAFAD